LRVSLYKLRSRGTPPRCRFRPANSRGGAPTVLRRCRQARTP